jgi:N-acetyl-anhydromuramyl-L-alanine amidase AmpD
MRDINRIVVHHSGTAKETTVHSIRNSHMNVRGWRDIGYHYIIEKNGALRLGRPDWMIGAHVKGKNRDSIGICVTGDCRIMGNGAPLDVQKETLFTLLEDLMIRYPGAEIATHKELARTLCPGELLKQLIYDWRR